MSMDDPFGPGVNQPGYGPASSGGPWPAYPEPGGYPPPPPTLPAVPAVTERPAPPMARGGVNEPVLITIGDIAVTQHHVITPNGTFPLEKTSWVVSDHTTVTEGIPAVAIVLAVIFFVVCLLGLLFLLMKEKKMSGFVQVSVQGPGFHHATQLPPGAGMFAQQQVAYVRNLVAALG